MNFNPMGAMHRQSAESAIAECSAHFQVFFSFVLFAANFLDAPSG